MELLAALVLTTLLMSAVSGVLTTIVRNQKAVLRNHGIPSDWEVQLDQLFSWDLENSRQITFTNTGIRLEGFAGRDLTTRVPIHCPCAVDYEIVEVEKRQHLIRRETHVELLNLDNSVTELICAEVSRIVVGPPATPMATASLDAAEKLTNGPLPSRVSITLMAGSPANAIYSRNFTRK